MTTFGKVVLLVATAGLAMACEVEESAQFENDESMAFFGIGPGGGNSCTVTEVGNFDVLGDWEVTGSLTQGCEDDEICMAFACNNAIPQTCYGTCASAPGWPGF